MSDCKYHIELDPSGETSHTLMLQLVGSNKRVLDVGCATGYLAAALAEQGNTVSGVEYDADAAEQARPHLDQLVIGDLETVDLVGAFGEAKFDVVVFGDVLEHLRDPVPVLRQARKLLAPAGSVVISVPNVAHGDVRLALLSGRFPYGKLGLLDVTHTRFFTRENLDVFLGDCGFVAADVRRTVAPLFGTELPVRREDYAPDVIAGLEADPEASTYQFVLRALPDDALTVDLQLTRQLERARLAIKEHEQRIAAVRAERDAAQAERDTLAGQLVAVQARLADLERQVTELDPLRRRGTELAEEIDRIHRTRLWRASRVPRKVYGTLRSRS